jgi:hypothetical protein
VDSFNLDQKARAYLKSESEFNHVRIKAFLELMMGLMSGHNMHLLSFNEVVDRLRLKETIYLGLQDIPVNSIVGSTGRYEDFTRHFLPRTWDKREKERWRQIYTLAVTGEGFPAIDVYKIDQVYFVQDGNHRVSVARDLGWDTIQANVTELPCSISLEPNLKPDDLLIKEECAYFLEQTRLDKTRPDSKQHIGFSEPGGYQRLLRNIELHRYLMNKAASDEPDQANSISLPEAAGDWYDNVYLPVVDAVRQMDVIKHFPGRSETDLYEWLVRHQSEIRRQHGLQELQLPATAQEFLQSLETST